MYRAYLLIDRTAYALRAPAAGYRKRWELVLRRFVFLAFIFLSHTALGADLVSRFGRVTSTDQDQEGKVHVSFEGKPFVSLEAEYVNLYRVTATSGSTEYVILETWVPGLNCHHEYLVLAIKDDRSFKLSPSFGDCMELAGASISKGGASIKLHTPSSLPGRLKFETFDVENGVVRKK
jgi:hypothetical protein